MKGAQRFIQERAVRPTTIIITTTTTGVFINDTLLCYRLQTSQRLTQIMVAVLLNFSSENSVQLHLYNYICTIISVLLYLYNILLLSLY